MSGICAVTGREGLQHTSGTLASVAHGLVLDASEQVSTIGEEGTGVGVSIRFPTQQLFEDPGVMVACDADLSNEKELWTQLNRAAGPTLDATARLIAALYERFGSEFVSRLQGAFSLALWDRRHKKLLAAVDRFGFKRLVYHKRGDLFMLASHIGSLVRSGLVRREINPSGIVNYLNFTVNLAPGTIIRDVNRLAPGTMLEFANGKTRVRSYWDMSYGENNATEATLSAELESIVERSVAAHCKEDSLERTGAFLSGGTDSSTVVGMMSRLSRGRVKAFSIGFEEQRFNELEYATIAARRFQAEHFTYFVNARDCFNAIPGMVRYFDEPFGNSSAIPTYFCARLAAQNGVNVLLAGDGGDELFGGNERYLRDKMFGLYHTIPGPLRKGFIEPALGAFPIRNGMVGKMRAYVRRSNTASPQRFFRHNFLCAHPLTEVFEHDFIAQIGDYAVLEVPIGYYRNAPAQEHLDRLLYIDVKITLGDSDLPKVMQMSEMAGIMTRFPLLDQAVAEFSGRVPPHLKLKRFDKRYLFKRAFRDLLPAEILRKQKHGFGIPVSTWIKSDQPMRELARDTLLSARARDRGYFRREFVEDLFQKHEADNTTYYGDTIWSFLMLELWHREYADQPLRANA